MVVAATLLALAAAPGEPVRPVGTPGRLRNERLSDERRLTRWAHPRRRGFVRRTPDVAARRIGRLRLRTEDGPREVVIVLRSHRDRAGNVTFLVRVPGRRPLTGWVRRSSLGDLHAVRTYLRIDRRALRATLRLRGRRIWSARIGIGAPGTPTPAGRFWVREKLPVPERDSLYGPWAIGTSAYSALSDWPGGGVIGLHGTNQPELIPGRPSHGCIRLRNEDVRRLVRRLPLGTPVAIG